MPRNFSVTFSQLLVVNADEDSSQVALMGKRGNRMHRKIKKQILEIMESIEEALQYMKRAQEADCRAMAEDCRMCTKTIADALDAEKETEKDVLDALSRFDQALDASLTFLAKRERWIFKLSVLQKQLTDVKKKIQEIETRIEVVFLPYKASMWDSLESVWLAANQDDRCDAYVVPVPYYERTPDHELGTFHYEGDLFPPDIPITHYDQYDLRKHRPDVVYIHYPYDACNYVTSIDPHYYTTELKKYTNMLIYIPYFVSYHTVSDTFCRMPAVYHADKVIVQSAAIQRQYSQYSQLPISKFLPLGSPKFDKVINAKKEDFSLLTLWRDRIQNKKVVLYNTGLSNIIGNSALMLEKLRYVFSCFMHRDDIILWWRPHPLSRSTASSMRPDVYAQYCAIEDWYKQKGIGIFDDTSDLHRAIAYTDAYYGDGSSLMPLYEATGKPIMMADIGRSCRTDHNYFEFCDCAVEGDILYFSENKFNGLFSSNLSTGESLFLGRFPKESEVCKNLYAAVALQEGKLFFAPSIAKEIAVYQIAKKMFIKLPVPLIDQVCEGAKFYSCVVYKKYVFMIGSTIPVVIKIDSQTLEVTCYTDWYIKNKDIFHNCPQDILFRHEAVVVANCFYTPSCSCNTVLEFNMDTGRSKLLKVGEKKNRYGSICYDGENFWLSPRFSGPIVCWHRLKNVVIEYDDLPIMKNVKGVGVSSSIEINRYIYIYFINSPFLLKIDPQTREFETVNLKAVKEIFFAKKEKGFVYVLKKEGAKSELLVYNIESKKKYTADLVIPGEWCGDIRESEKAYLRDQIYNKNNCLVSEYWDASLEGFLDVLGTNQKNTSAQRKNIYDGKCGKRIHETIMGLGIRQ